MTDIDFSKLPVDGKRFEALVCELLRSMGYPILEEPAEGPDGGRDILIERITRDALVERRERVVVQCKHYANSGRAVSEGDIGVWQNALDRFNAMGYLLITSTTVTENLNKVFLEFSKNKHPQFATFWSAERLELLLSEHPEVRDAFFPLAVPKASHDLGQHGFGVVYPAVGISDDVRSALQPLLELRRHQVESSNGVGIFKEFSDANGVLAGEPAVNWLARNGVGPGSPDPKKIPFFLLLVGDPGNITFDFQANLAVQYYVGRLHFSQTENYSRYVDAVLRAEYTGNKQTRNVNLFAPDVDRTTRMTSEFLVKTIEENPCGRHPDWNVRRIEGKDVHKQRVLDSFFGSDEASLVFVASHGLILSLDDEQQVARQGALITDTWEPGKKTRDEDVVLAEDIDSDIERPVSFYFLFGCFGAGTMVEDDYRKASTGQTRILTREPFIAALPQRLLACGSLGIIGHVGEAWTSSFMWKDAGPQPQTFVAVLESLMSGESIGVAMQALSKRYAELAAIISSLESNHSRSQELSNQEIASLKSAMLDAKYYIALGDPAVRLH